MLPAPESDVMTIPFLDAAARHVLQCPRWDACGLRFFTPQFARPSCLSEGWSWEASAGHGSIYSTCGVYRAPSPGIHTPYVLGAGAQHFNLEILS